MMDFISIYAEKNYKWFQFKLIFDQKFSFVTPPFTISTLTYSQYNTGGYKGMRGDIS